MRKFAFFLLVVALFSGCGVLSKTAVQNRYFVLGGDENAPCYLPKSKDIKVADVRSKSVFDTKDILIVDENFQIYPLEYAKWITLPSQMIYAKILNEIEGSCEFKSNPKFSNLTLQTELLSLNSTSQKAVVSLGISLSKNGEILQNRVVLKTKNLISKEPNEVVKSLNLALDEAVSEILEILKEAK